MSFYLENERKSGEMQKDVSWGSLLQRLAGVYKKNPFQRDEELKKDLLLA